MSKKFDTFVVRQAFLLSTFLKQQHAHDFRKTEFWLKNIWVLQYFTGVSDLELSFFVMCHFYMKQKAHFTYCGFPKIWVLEEIWTEFREISEFLSNWVLLQVDKKKACRKSAQTKPELLTVKQAFNEKLKVVQQA